MKYELAKELKDAGFSQELPDPSSYYAGTMEKKLFGWSEGEDKPYGDYVKCPTLSELIEACASEFTDSKLLFVYTFSLTWDENKKKWCACYDGPVGARNIWFGSIPEEAVARLWLALNKK